MMKPSKKKETPKEARKPLKRPPSAVIDPKKAKAKARAPSDKNQSVLQGFESSRLRNLDISEELAMSSDIVFDQELLSQQRARAAKTIQRWFKDLLQTRMMREAEQAIEQTKGLLKLKKQHLVKKHIHLRESVACHEEAQKENFNVFACLQEKPKRQEEQQSAGEEENKLKDLNELLRNKDFSIADHDHEFDQFLRKLNESRPKHSPPRADFSIPDISHMTHEQPSVQEEVSRIISSSLSPKKTVEPVERPSATSSVQGEKYLDLMRILENDQPPTLFRQEQPLESLRVEREDYESRSKLVELQIEKEENEKALDLLKQLREKERNELRAAVESVRAQGEKQAEDVKQQMTMRLEKQVAMIESLLADKKALSEKLEQMADKSKDVEREKEKLKTVLEQRFQVELKKNKDAWVAGERVRKEKWEMEKIDEIKSTTVKKLEPTIQQLIENNKEELRKAHDQARQEVKRQKDLLTEMFEKKTDELRERLIREKEDALEKEREKSQGKAHDQFARLEAQFMEERRRWKEMADNDLERVETARRKEKDQMDAQMKILQERTEAELQKQAKKAEERQEELQRRHQVELKQLKEQLRAQSEEWRDDFMRKQKEASVEQAKKVREEMVRERNREIEAIINKLGDETHDTQKQILLQYEKKAHDLQQKSRAEIEDLKAQLAQWKDKHKSENEQRHLIDESVRVLSRRVHDLEMESTDRKERLLTCEQEKQDLTAKLSIIYKEQASIRAQIEEELRGELEEKESAIRRVKEEKMASEHRLRQEVEEVKVQNKQELEVIQEKIEAALEKKNRNISLLHEEIKSKDVQIVKLREMLEKQRRELLK